MFYYLFEESGSQDLNFSGQTLVGLGHNHWPPHCLVSELGVLVRQNEVLEFPHADRLVLVHIDPSKQGLKLTSLELYFAVHQVILNIFLSDLLSTMWVQPVEQRSWRKILLLSQRLLNYL